MRFSACTFAALFAALHGAAAIGHGHSVGPKSTLKIGNKVISPDGFSRPVVTVNGQHPSPLIKAKKGDNFRIKVKNNINDPTLLRQTSVHWHGIFQHDTPTADGADGVTQCPIAQFGDEYTYRFTAGPNEAGTFWYHSHFGSQYCDGLRGPLVIYDPNDPHKHLYDVDDESTIITLADWYHLQSPSFVAHLDGPISSHATLINGKGRSVGGPASPVEVIEVKQGKRYRFRIISIACDPYYTFSIDGHRLTIIETDGQATVPYTVDRIEILAGQRYSVVVHANRPVGNYWIRSPPQIGVANLENYSSNGINSAILRYKGAPKVFPPENPVYAPNPANPGVLLEERFLQALVNPAAPGGSGEADIKINFDIGISSDLKQFSMNGAPWTHPDSPIMVQIMNGVPAEDLVPSGAMMTLPRNKVVEVSVPGFDFAGPHPMHLHGHAFSVIRSVGSTTPNYVNPVRRDVVNIGGSGNNVTFRFYTDNPGPWFFHCHIEFHVLAGFGMIFLEAPGEMPTPPTKWNDLCPRYDSLPASAKEITILPALDD